VKKSGVVLIAAVAMVTVSACSESSPDTTVQTAEPVVAAQWSVHNCAVLGPGTIESGSWTKPGETVIVESDGAGVPEVLIDESQTSASSLEIIDVTVGTGDAVQPGEFLEVEYCGIGLQTREVFDSSWARGQTASFPLDGLIQGWQEGLPGMQVGGQRVLVIPGELAYGEFPPPGIEPNETLIFVIDLVGRG
jgi:peptidylprolyl isomerase